MINLENYKGFRELISLSDKYSPIEGNIGKYPKKMEFYVSLFRSIKPKFICEIGFNSGLSCCLALNNISSSSFVYSFDLGEHNYCGPAIKILQKHFKNFEVILGDSKKTLRDFLTRNILFDLFFIDGGHDYETCQSDIRHCMSGLNKNGVILIDDMKLKPVRKAVKSINWNGFVKIPVVDTERPMACYQKDNLL